MFQRIDPALRPLVRRHLKENKSLALASGSRHLRVIHLGTRDFVLVAGSAGDRRCAVALNVALRRLSSTGQGFIQAHKTGGNDHA